MPSSISSSEPATLAAADPSRWRRFFLIALATAVGSGLALYAFVALVDPWNALPLSPRWQRAPISSNQRFSYPALARSPRFDSVLVGTSTSRLLRPVALDAVLGGRFANLSMNSASPYELSRLLDLFRRDHADIGTVVIGIDIRWCEPDVPKYSYLAFPEWMYGTHRWRGYAHVFSLYAVQEAFAQFAYLLGLKRPRYGFDGYADFLPDDRGYDPVRAVAHLKTPLPRVQAADELRDQPNLRSPVRDYLPGMLSGLPPLTRKIVLLTPLHMGNRAPPGSSAAAPIAACKFRIAEIARGVPRTTVVDFMIDSPLTRTATNFWDPRHFRVAVADRIVAALGAVTKNPRSTSSDFRVLVP